MPRNYSTRYRPQSAKPTRRPCLIEPLSESELATIRAATGPMGGLYRPLPYRTQIIERLLTECDEQEDTRRVIRPYADRIAEGSHDRDDY